MKKKIISILKNIGLAMFNIIFLISYFIMNLILMPFYRFKLPKVSPYHVSNPYVGAINLKEFFNDKFIQSKQFPYERESRKIN